jgi:hypothetical protein
MPEDTIEAALQELREKRSQIDQAIAALEQLGGGTSSLAGTSSTPSSSTSAPSRQLTSPRGGPLVVHPGEFYNMSLTKAAVQLLKRAGHPLKTMDLFAALRRAEFPLNGKAPESTLYTSLTRSKDFVKVLPNTWALSEWHPEAATAPKPSTKKRRRRAKRQGQAASEAPTAGIVKRGPGRPPKASVISRVVSTVKDTATDIAAKVPN